MLNSRMLTNLASVPPPCSCGATPKVYATSIVKIFPVFREHLAPLHCPLSEPRPAPPLRRMAPTPFELVVAEPYRRLQSSQDQGDLGNTVRRCTATAHAAAPRGCRTFPCLPNAALSLPTKWTRLVLTTALRGAAHVSQLAILLGLIIMLTGVCAFLGWYSRRRG